MHNTVAKIKEIFRRKEGIIKPLLDSRSSKMIFIYIYIYIEYIYMIYLLTYVGMQG